MPCLDDVRPVVLVTAATSAWGQGVVRELQRRGRFTPRPLPGPLPDHATLTLSTAGCCAVVSQMRAASDGCNLLDAMADAGASHLVLAASPASAAGADAYAASLGIALSWVPAQDAKAAADALERRLIRGSQGANRHTAQ